MRRDHAKTYCLEKGAFNSEVRILKKRGKVKFNLNEDKIPFPPTAKRLLQGQGKETEAGVKSGLAHVLSRGCGKNSGTRAYILKCTTCLSLTGTGIFWAFFLCHPWFLSFLQLGYHTRFGKLISCL